MKSCISGFGESCDVSLTRLWLGGKSLVSSATQRVAAASENVRDTLYSIRFPRPAMAISVSHSSRGKFQRFLNTRRMTFLQDSGSTCSLAGANKPPIVALLHHVHNVSFVQLHLVGGHGNTEGQHERRNYLVVVLWFVVVEGSEGGRFWLSSSVGHGGARPRDFGGQVLVTLN